MRVSGVGCDDCATPGLRGCACANGLGLAPAAARASSNPDAGLGALPGPSLIDDLLASASSVQAQLTLLESELLDAQQRLLAAEGQAQRKNQGALVTEAHNAYRASINLVGSYRSATLALSQSVTALQQAKQEFSSGASGLLTIMALSIRLGATVPFTVSSARQLLVDVPRFSQQTADLVERVNAASMLQPSQSVLQTFTSATTMLPKTAMWIALGVGIVYLVPRLLPRRDRV